MQFSITFIFARVNLGTDFEFVRDIGVINLKFDSNLALIVQVRLLTRLDIKRLVFNHHIIKQMDF